MRSPRLPVLLSRVSPNSVHALRAGVPGLIAASVMTDRNLVGCAGFGYSLSGSGAVCFSVASYLFRCSIVR